MNKKLTKKKIMMGAFAISAAAIPITGVLAYENSSNNDNNTTANEVAKEKSTDDKMVEKNSNMGKPRKERQNKSTNEEKSVTNGETPPELPDGEMPEMNGEAPPDMADGEMPDGEAPPELQDGERPEMNGEAPPDISNDKTLNDSTKTENNDNFFDMLKKLPTNFVNWLKNLFSKK